MGNFENPSQKTLRLAKEARIKDYHKSGDTFSTNKELDTYPYGKPRPGLMLKEARRLARQAIERANNPTVEIPIVRRAA